MYKEWCSTYRMIHTLTRHSDVLGALTTTRSLYTSFLRIRSLSPPSSIPSPELLSAHSELLASLRAVEEDVSDLRMSITAMEAHPSTYNLSTTEVARRRRMVEETSREIEDMREELDRSKTSGFGSGIARDRKGKGREGNADDKRRTHEHINENTMRSGDFVYEDNDDDDDDDENDNRDYDARFQQQQQQRLWREQDGMLDDVSRTVGNLRLQASDMGRELEEQAEMLDHVDGLADRVGGRLKGGLKTMGEVVRRGEDRWSGICVWLLIAVLCFLLFLVVVL